MRIRAWLSSAAVSAALAAASMSAHAALLGLTPAEPTIDFGGAGIVDYNAATGIVTFSGIPATFFQSDPFLFGQIAGATGDDESLITVQFKVDSAGGLVSGVDGPDLTVKGSVDVDFDGIADYDGVLLTADVTQFGFENGADGGDDAFDLRLNNVSGLLASFYTGQDLALRIVSEASDEFPSPFNGSFAADFVGQAKGVLGGTQALQPPLCKLDVEAFCSVNNAPLRSKCRIQVTKSPKHWDWEDRQCHGHTYRRYTYGMHGDPIPSWASRYHSTDVKFVYVLKNKGTTPVSEIVVDDSFDTPVTGVPATLAPGATAVMTRIEKLHEPIEDVVITSGVYQTAQCGDTDTVLIKDKLRDRRRHDYDNFRDKGERDNSPYR